MMRASAVSVVLMCGVISAPCAISQQLSVIYPEGWKELHECPSMSAYIPPNAGFKVRFQASSSKYLELITDVEKTVDNTVFYKTYLHIANVAGVPADIRKSVMSEGSMMYGIVPIAYNSYQQNGDLSASRTWTYSSDLVKEISALKVGGSVTLKSEENSQIDGKKAQTAGDVSIRYITCGEMSDPSGAAQVSVFQVDSFGLMPTEEGDNQPNIDRTSEIVFLDLSKGWRLRSQSAEGKVLYHAANE